MVDDEITSVHHSDRGVQYVSIRYTERLAEAGIEPSVGSAGDSCDKALAESIMDLYKTDVIRQGGPWRHLEAVEFATLVEALSFPLPDSWELASMRPPVTGAPTSPMAAHSGRRGWP